MALADVVHETQEPCGLPFNSTNSSAIASRLDYLSKECYDKLTLEGFDSEHIVLEPYLHLRYEGTDCALMCSPSASSAMKLGSVKIDRYGDFYSTFLERYRNEFGFVLAGRNVIVDDIRVRGSGKTATPTEVDAPIVTGKPVPESQRKVYFDEGYEETPIFLCSKLGYGHEISGPAILIDNLSTILIERNSTCCVTKKGDLVITIGSGHRVDIDDRLDAVQLSIFSHRFMSIAEQMGRILQRTSISTNIKERLDFSCALFGPDGGLVSNAPHIPVHLGAMQETVQFQLKFRGDTLKPGDVLLSNHPQAGGSHLPDLTVITPVFYKLVLSLDKSSNLDKADYSNIDGNLIRQCLLRN